MYWAHFYLIFSIRCLEYSMKMMSHLEPIRVWEISMAKPSIITQRLRFKCDRSREFNDGLYVLYGIGKSSR